MFNPLTVTLAALARVLIIVTEGNINHDAKIEKCVNAHIKRFGYGGNSAWEREAARSERTRQNVVKYMNKKERQSNEKHEGRILPEAP